MWRIENCPGSWRATKDLPEDESADAAKGTDLHAKLEADDTDAESMSDEWALQRAIEQRDEIVAEWSQGAPVEIFTELRLGLTVIGGTVIVNDDTKIGIHFTGQADYIAICGDRGLIVDYKMLYGQHQDARENSQLRALAVLAAGKWKLLEVRVAKVQPRLGKPSLADYDAFTLGVAKKALLNALWTADNATPADLKAGDWCQWCKARAACPALRAKALVPVNTLTRSLPQDEKTAQAAIFARLMELDADTLASYMKDLRLMRWVASAIEGAAKTRAKDDPAFQQYYRLKPGVVRKKIVDVGAVFQRCHELGITGEEFTGACSLTQNKLEPLVRKATGAKGKALADKIGEVLAGATESKQTAEQLEEVKL
jgi:hypothetical protein